MKAKEMKKLALMGMAAGLVTMGNAELQANLDQNVVDLDYVIAKAKCESHGGCGGLTASRDTTGKPAASDAAPEEEEITDEDYDDVGVDQPV